MTNSGLVPVGPVCSHGVTIGKYEVPPGATVWAPECTTRQGYMKEHKAPDSVPDKTD